jgi:beta-N-acetylhexosaminidase
MICHRLDAAEEAKQILETLPPAELDRALASLSDFKTKLAPPTDFSIEEHQRLDEEVWKLRVATLGEEQAAERSAEDGKRSPVEVY